MLHVDASCVFFVLFVVDYMPCVLIFFLFSIYFLLTVRVAWGGGDARLPLFVLFSLFSRPRAGLVTECEKQYWGMLRRSRCVQRFFNQHRKTSLGFSPTYSTFFFFFFINLTYSRWTSSLPSCLWSQRIFPSLPGSRLPILYRDASSALLTTRQPMVEYSG